MLSPHYTIQQNPTLLTIKARFDDAGSIQTTSFRWIIASNIYGEPSCSIKDNSSFADVFTQKLSDCIDSLLFIIVDFDYPEIGF